jgi:hypothetical protein
MFSLAYDNTGISDPQMRHLSFAKQCSFEGMHAQSRLCQIWIGNIAATLDFL